MMFAGADANVLLVSQMHFNSQSSVAFLFVLSFPHHLLVYCITIFNVQYKHTHTHAAMCGQLRVCTAFPSPT